MSDLRDHHHEIDKVIGANLRHLRTERGHTLVTLGKAVSCTYQQIQKYEKGANRISASTLLTLSRTLEVPITEFFKGAGDYNA